MSKVVATLVANFGENAVSPSGSISLEWEELTNPDGTPKTQYGAGEIANILVHAEDTVEVLEAKVTDGEVLGRGDDILPRTARIGWGSYDDEQSLGYTPSGSLSCRWYGNAGSGQRIDGRKVTMTGGQMPCLADVSYPVRFTRFPVRLPEVVLTGDERWPVRAYVYYLEEVDDGLDS